MYFVIVKDIASGRIVDKAELSATDNIGGEIAHLAWLTKKQFENRYPPDQYYTFYEKADSWQELQNKLETDKSNQTTDQPNRDNSFTMIGSRANQLIVNISAIIIGIFLLFILLVLRLLYNPFLFISGIFILFLYLYLDYKRWMKKGIQMVEIDAEGINIYRGSEMVLTRIDKKQITGINVFKKLNRRIANILLGGQADSSLPGVTLFSGPRIRITDDAFNEAEFGIFIKKLYELKPELINNTIGEYK